MIGRLLDLLFGRKCRVCLTRYRYVDLHEAADHTPVEWMQYEASRG